MIALLRSEFLKLRTTRTAMGLLIAAIVVSLLPGVIMFLFAPESFLRENDSLGVTILGLTVVPMLAFAFGILGMTNEYRHGTVTNAYLATPHRARVIVVKLIAYALVGVAIMVVTGLVVVLVAAIGFAARGVPFPDVDTASSVSASDLGDIGLFLATVGLITAFGVALGALFRAQVATVTGGLVWAIILEPIVTGLKPSIGKWLPFTVFQQLNIGGARDASTAMLLSRPEAFGIALLYIGAVSALAVFTSMRRDVT